MSITLSSPVYVDHRDVLQRKGVTSPCLASVLIEDINAKYGGTPEAAFYKTIAKNLSGVSYAGTSVVLPTLAYIGSDSVGH